MANSLGRSWPVLVVALGLAAIVVAWLTQPIVGGDTTPLMAGTEQLGRCLAALDLRNCQQTTPIGPYPILQYLPDLAADAGTELSTDGRVRILALLSGVGIATAVAAAWAVMQRIGCPAWRWGVILVAVSGPVIAYGSATWGEMLATGVLTLFVATTLLPASPALVGIAALGAAVTKETGFPYVLALGLVGLLLTRRRTGMCVRAHAVGGLVGVALGLVVNAAFNILRFGTPRNVTYLDPGLRTPSLGRGLEHAAGLLLSPNGGMLFFWPLATLVVVGALAPPIVSACRRETAWRPALPSLALTAIVVGLTAGLAAWWSPFGWWAWGPRLTLPWVMPVVLLALAAYGAALTPHVARILGSNLALAGVAAITVVLSLPHVGFLWRPETVGEFFFFHQTALCPGGSSGPGYYACLREEMWTRPPILLDALAGLTSPAGIGTASAVAAVTVGCLVQFRRDVREGRHDAAEAADPAEGSRIVAT